MGSARIGIVLPAYNEATTIAHVLATIPDSLVHEGITYALTPIVVDDGSNDHTAKLAKSHRRAIVIRHLLNSGAGAATRTGLHYLREKDFAFGATMDSDGQHAAEDLEKVLHAILAGKSDFVVGSRLLNATNMPAYKVIGNKGLSVLTQLLLGVRSTDSQSGLKAFNRITLERLSYNENGYAFCSEMLWRANRAGLKISEVPIQAIYTDYSTQKGQSNWNGFQIVKQLIKHRIAGWTHE